MQFRGESSRITPRFKDGDFLMIALTATTSLNFWQSYVDIMRVIFSDISTALPVILFIAVIIPAIISFTLSYRARDLSGYISYFLFWCICAFFIVLSPVSLLLYFMYRHIYTLYMNRNEAKRSAPPPSVTIPSVSTVVTPTAQRTTPASASSPAYRVCHFMWTRSDIFCDHIQKNSSLQSKAFIWTAFFYSITKHVRNQNIVDELYAQFKAAVEPFIASSQNKAMSFYYIQTAYWQLRSILNSSGIDPRTQEGVSELWFTVAALAFPGISLPENALTAFSLNMQMVTTHALEIYHLKAVKEHYYFDID